LDDRDSSEVSEEGAGESAEGRAEAAAERREEAATAARGVVADVEEFGGNAEGAAKKIGVDAIKAGEALQGGHLALKGGVGEGQLILLGLAGFGNSLLAREFVGEFAEAGGVAGARDTVCRGLLEGIESAGERTLRLTGDGSLVGGAEARIVQDALILWEQQIADLLLLAEELLVH